MSEPLTSSDWKLNTSQANQDPNSFLELTKGNAKLVVSADMIGIGGVGRDYEGTPVSVGGTTLNTISFSTLLSGLNNSIF